MQEKKTQPQQPTQNLQMMRVEPRKEDQSINIMLRSGMTTSTDKGKQFEEEGWVYKALKKEAGFDLDHAKETFMEAKKSFTEASTSGSRDKVQETNVPKRLIPLSLLRFCIPT